MSVQTVTGMLGTSSIGYTEVKSSPAADALPLMGSTASGDKRVMVRDGLPESVFSIHYRFWNQESEAHNPPATRHRTTTIITRNADGDLIVL